MWRYDLEIGALLADSQYKKNSGGWGAYQNYVEGDYIIPTHCSDYANLVGAYWGMPCKVCDNPSFSLSIFLCKDQVLTHSCIYAQVTYDQASQQFLFIDSLHNDTDDPAVGRKVVVIL